MGSPSSSWPTRRDRRPEGDDRPRQRPDHASRSPRPTTPSASSAARRWASPTARCSAISATRSAIITGTCWCATAAGSTPAARCSATTAQDYERGAAAPLRGGRAGRLAAAFRQRLRHVATRGRISPRPGRITCTSSTRSRWRRLRPAASSPRSIGEGTPSRAASTSIPMSRAPSSTAHRRLDAAHPRDQQPQPRDGPAGSLSLRAVAARSSPSCASSTISCAAPERKSHWARRRTPPACCRSPARRREPSGFGGFAPRAREAQVRRSSRAASRARRQEPSARDGPADPWIERCAKRGKIPAVAQRVDLQPAGETGPLAIFVPTKQMTDCRSVMFARGRALRNCVSGRHAFYSEWYGTAGFEKNGPSSPI